jgi:hypothetical protein
MRETTLGRWMVRLAVTVGVGAVVLGVSAATAQASDVRSTSGLASLSAVKAVSVAHALETRTQPTLRVTEDFDWS